jgi:hypothetical protein
MKLSKRKKKLRQEVYPNEMRKKKINKGARGGGLTLEPVPLSSATQWRQKKIPTDASD